MTLVKSQNHTNDLYLCPVYVYRYVNTIIEIACDRGVLFFINIFLCAV